MIVFLLKESDLEIIQKLILRAYNKVFTFHTHRECLCMDYKVSNMQLGLTMGNRGMYIFTLVRMFFLLDPPCLFILCFQMISLS